MVALLKYRNRDFKIWHTRNVGPMTSLVLDFCNQYRDRSNLGELTDFESYVMLLDLTLALLQNIAVKGNGNHGCYVMHVAEKIYLKI